MKNRVGLIVYLSTATCAISMAAIDAVAVTGRVASKYYVTDIGDPTDGTAGSYAFAINDHGQVTGGNLPTGSATFVGLPFLWTPTTSNSVDGSRSLLTLPTVTVPPGPFGPGGTMTLRNGVGYDINAYGQVIGVAESSYGFLWTPSTTNGSAGVTLLTNSLGTSETPTSINARGQIAFSTKLFTPTTANGTAGSLTTLNVSGNAYINDRGDVIGSSNLYFRPTVANGTTGTNTALPAAIALNNSGYYVTSQNRLVHLSDDSTPAVLSSTTITGVNTVTAINDANVVVDRGGNSVNAWSAVDGAVSLNTRLESHSGAGWRIIAARDINNVGQIVGAANRNGVNRAVLLTPLTDGDATIDQHVDFNDLLALAKSYGTTATATWRDGDFTGEGDVNFDDLLLLAKNYGGGTAGALAAETSERFAADWSFAQSLVPEPSAMLALMTVVTVARSRRRVPGRCVRG